MKHVQIRMKSREDFLAISKILGTEHFVVTDENFGCDPDAKKELKTIYVKGHRTLDVSKEMAELGYGIVMVSEGRWEESYCDHCENLVDGDLTEITIHGRPSFACESCLEKLGENGWI